MKKILNERGLATEESHLWQNTNVYFGLKRYPERQIKLKSRSKKYTLVCRNLDGIYKVDFS